MRSLYRLSFCGLPLLVLFCTGLRDPPINYALNCRSRSTDNSRNFWKTFTLIMYIYNYFPLFYSSFYVFSTHCTYTVSNTVWFLTPTDRDDGSKYTDIVAECPDVIVFCLQYTLKPYTRAVQILLLRLFLPAVELFWIFSNMRLFGFFFYEICSKHL